MNKQQAEQILRQLIDNLKLTRQEYVTLLQAIEVMKIADVIVEDKPAKK
jgi:hypothetical protein